MNLLYVTPENGGYKNIEYKATFDILKRDYGNVEEVHSLDKVNNDTFGMFIEADYVVNWDSFKEELDRINEESEYSLNIYIRFLESPLNMQPPAEDFPNLYDIHNQYIIKQIASNSNVKMAFSFNPIVELGEFLFNNAILFPPQSYNLPYIINAEYSKPSVVTTVKQCVMMDLRYSRNPTRDFSLLCETAKAVPNFIFKIFVTPGTSIDCDDKPENLFIEDVVDTFEEKEEDKLVEGNINEKFKEGGILLDLNHFSRYSPIIPMAQSYGCLLICMDDSVTSYSESAIRLKSQLVPDIISELSSILLNLEVNQVLLSKIKKGMIYSNNIKGTDKYNMIKALLPYYNMIVDSMGGIDLSEGE